MKNKIKLGVFSWFGYDLPLVDCINMIKNIGFDSTMLWWEEELFSKDGEEQLNKIRNIDINIENLHVPYYECNLLWSNDKIERKDIVDKHLRWIRGCNKYKIPMIVMHLTRGYDLKSVNEYGLYSLEKIVSEAEKYKVKIAIENTRKDEFVEEILESINSPYLGLCYDSSHANLWSKNNSYLLDKYKDRVIALHISDNNGKKDNHWLPCGKE
ncbi:sugar phosphate isomerase/epimerase family protein [Caloranaerobacter sp. DY30410]|uniref:sugar phosphate isomerase/epimerase family protein n=1 Tax=Caloranaerobacter sp. DY30410 TaxID=3238305 RepID=UPI003D08818F